MKKKKRQKHITLKALDFMAGVFRKKYKEIEDEAYWEANTGSIIEYNPDKGTGSSQRSPNKEIKDYIYSLTKGDIQKTLKKAEESLSEILEALDEFDGGSK